MHTQVMKIIVGFILIAVFITACSSKSNFEPSPVDEIVKSLSDKSDFSIILYDMDAEDSASTTVYKHKYRIIQPEEDTVMYRETKWFKVSDVFFDKHINDMGMEIATKKDGQLQRQASPAGYTHFIGNDKYGSWTQRNGYNFWEFYGRYAFMSSLFNLRGNPVRRSYHRTYYDRYYGSGRSYYGPSGRRYGTRTYTTNGAGTNSTWGSKPSNFKNKVRSRVSKSAVATKRRRSASRSSRSTSYRSRGGGSGK